MGSWRKEMFKVYRPYKTHFLSIFEFVMENCIAMTKNFIYFWNGKLTDCIFDQKCGTFPRNLLWAVYLKRFLINKFNAQMVSDKNKIWPDDPQ